MNLQYQEILDEPSHSLVLFFLYEGFNFLNIEFIFIKFNIVINIWTPEYSKCFTVDIVPCSVLYEH